jgi:hypothetical protein
MALDVGHWREFIGDSMREHCPERYHRPGEPVRPGPTGHRDVAGIPAR